MNDHLRHYGESARRERDEAPLPPLRSTPVPRGRIQRLWVRRTAMSSSLAACLALGWFLGIHGAADPVAAMQSAVHDTVYVTKYAGTDTIVITEEPPSAPSRHAVRGRTAHGGSRPPQVTFPQHRPVGLPHVALARHTGSGNGIAATEQKYASFRRSLP